MYDDHNSFGPEGLFTNCGDVISGLGGGELASEERRTGLKSRNYLDATDELQVAQVSDSDEGLQIEKGQGSIEAVSHTKYHPCVFAMQPSKTHSDPTRSFILTALHKSCG